jgi:hypothetical protein
MGVHSTLTFILMVLTVDCSYIFGFLVACLLLFVYCVWVLLFATPNFRQCFNSFTENPNYRLGKSRFWDWLTQVRGFVCSCSRDFGQNLLGPWEKNYHDLFPTEAGVSNYSASAPVLYLVTSGYVIQWLKQISWTCHCYSCLRCFVFNQEYTLLIESHCQRRCGT